VATQAKMRSPSMRSIVTAAAWLPAVVQGSVSSVDTCAFLYDENGVTASYDLAPLINDYGPYAISDRFMGSDGVAYSYFFNVCQNVSASSIPSSVSCDVAVAGAYQVIGSVDFCKATGSTDQASFQLLSDYLNMDLDPAMGVVLTYGGGEQCGENGANRTTHIVIECSDDENIPDDEEMEEADRLCDYVLQLPSKVGCPTQCPVGGSGRRICSGRGVCGFDNEIRQVGWIECLALMHACLGCAQRGTRGGGLGPVLLLRGGLR